MNYDVRKGKRVYLKNNNHQMRTARHADAHLEERATCLWTSDRFVPDDEAKTAYFLLIGASHEKSSEKVT
jgi:hypothetical protein